MGLKGIEESTWQCFSRFLFILEQKEEEGIVNVSLKVDTPI
ncbi:hypothetical protein GGR98_002400 [Parageobacillus caldoxylosilyticus]|jgi:hypothetical protein|nr:hypothetical protein [Parageobacillus caldoxylosilyticus]